VSVGICGVWGFGTSYLYIPHKRVSIFYRDHCELHDLTPPFCRKSPKKF